MSPAIDRNDAYDNHTVSGRSLLCNKLNNIVLPTLFLLDTAHCINIINSAQNGYGIEGLR